MINHAMHYFALTILKRSLIAIKIVKQEKYSSSVGNLYIGMFSQQKSSETRSE